jgi:hypothetical protein
MDNVFAVICISVSLACGMVGLAVGTAYDGMLMDFGVGKAQGPAFLVGAMVGLLFSSIQIAAVASTIKTVIVCYAEAPAEFHIHHPDLSRQVRSSLVQSWPDISV